MPYLQTRTIAVVMNKNLLISILIFSSFIKTAPTQPPFLGVYSVDVVVKEVVKNPESSKSFTIDSDRFFSFFRMTRSFQNISPNGQSSIHECSRLFTEHCKSLAEAKQTRKTNIITYNLSFPDEDFSCAIKLIARKVDSQLLATFTIFVPKKNDPEISAALINFCNAAIPRLSFMQKHQWKVYTGITVLTIASPFIYKKIQIMLNQRAARISDEKYLAEVKRRCALSAKEQELIRDKIKNKLFLKLDCIECKDKDQCISCLTEQPACPICLVHYIDGEDKKISIPMKCLHPIHTECLAAWNESNGSNTECIICNIKIRR